MKLFEFSGAVAILCEFYERKEPKHSSVELWFESVEKIPTEPINWIVKKIQKTHESFPKNLPSSFWSGYYEWEQTHPEKKAFKTFFNCPDCVEGLIFAQHTKSRNKFVFRCGRCRQDNTMAYPFANRQELLEEYEVRK